MAIKKFFKRAAKKATGAVKKRYVNKRGGLRMSKFAADLALVKRALNVEKKNIEFIEQQDIAIGQYSGASDTGQSVTDLTPVIAQGVGYNQRTGNSVKIVSCMIKGQIKQQSATRHPMRIKLCLYKVVGTPISTSTILSGGQILQVNPLTGCTDYNSDRNVNYFKEFKLLQTKYVYLQPDPTSGEIMINNFKFLLKMNHHLKWNNDTTTLTDGQLVLHAFCDSGNSNLTVAGTGTSVPVLAVNTGAILQMYSKFYYVDN